MVKAVAFGTVGSHMPGAPTNFPVITDSGPLPKRALSIPEQLDATVRQIRRHLWYMLAPVFGVLTPIVLIEGALGIQHSFDLTGFFESSQGGLLGSEGLFTTVNSMLVWTLFNGMVLPMVTIWLMINAQRHLIGEKPKAIPPWGILLRTYLTWLCSQGLLWTPMILFSIIGATFFADADRSGTLSGVSPLFFLLTIALMILWPIWMIWQAITFLAPGLTIVQGLGPFAAIKKSVLLVKRNAAIVIGMFFAISISLAITAGVLGGLPALLLSIPSDYEWATRGLAIVLGSGITAPLSAMANMILVRDVLIRGEGADLAYRIDQLKGKRPTAIVSTPGVDWGQGDS